MGVQRYDLLAMGEGRLTVAEALAHRGAVLHYHYGKERYSDVDVMRYYEWCSAPIRSPRAG